MTTTVARSSNIPSALAMAVVFGGGLGLTLSHKLGLTGNIGFLIGTTSVFLLLALLIINDRKKEEEFTVDELEKNIIRLRRDIYESFVSSFVSTRDGIEVNDQVAETLESIRTALLSDDIRRFATEKLRPSEDLEKIEVFSREAAGIIERLKGLQDRLDVDTPLRGLEILKRQADAEIIAIDKKGSAR